MSTAVPNIPLLSPPAATKDPVGTTLRRLVVALVLLGLLCYGIAEDEGPMTVVFLAGAAAGWLVTRLAPGWGIPRWATALVLLGILFWAIAEVMEGTPMVTAFTTFLASIVVLRLWEARRVRDEGQLIVLAVFLMIGAVLTSATFWVGLTLLMATPLVAAAALVYQIARGREDAGAGGVSVRVWRSVRRSLWRTASACTLSAGALGVALFLFVPRAEPVGGMMVRIPSPAIGRQTGFADRVDVGQGGLVSESPAVAFEMAVRREGSRAVYGSSMRTLYLRGLVLSRYERGVWTAGEPEERSRREVGSQGQAVRVGEFEPGREVIDQVISARGSARELTPMFGLSRIIMVESLRPAGEVLYRINTSTGTVLFKQQSPAPARYRVRSQVEDETPPEGIWERRTVERLGSDGLRELAAETLRAHGVEPDPAKRSVRDDIRAARLLEAFVAGRCRYDLSAPPAPLGEEPTEWFLMTTRRGWCEHFASALAVLCREVGIEARVVAGYRAGEYDTERGVYVVRESDAHAWVEVRTGERHWTTLDATPPSELARLAEERRGIRAAIARVLDTMESVWNTRVAMFDAAAQARLMGRRPGQPGWNDELVAGIRAIVRGDGGEEGEAVPATRAWAGSAAVVIVAAVLWWWLMRRRARPAWRREIPPEVAGLHADLERVLARRYGIRPAWMPPGKHAREADGEVSEAIRVIYETCFGERRPDAGEVARARRALREVAGGR
jgi:hypothetical protein